MQAAHHKNDNAFDFKFETLTNMIPWNGSPRIIAPNSPTLNLPQSTIGNMILASQNMDPKNNQGLLFWTSGGTTGSVQQTALQNAPNILIQNWNGNNLNVSNISTAASTNLWVSAYGPGFGQTIPLGSGEPVNVNPYQAASAKTLPQFQRLSLSSNAQYAVIAVFIGTQVSTYVLNAPDQSTVPAGYTQVTSSNSLAFVNNWLGQTMYVANLSPSTGSPIQVQLTTL